MFLKVLRDFSKPHWFDIVMELKGTTGMSVSELAKRLKMSYMGMKQHCVDLEKKGYLDTWRRPKPVGRPEKVYRLTTKTNPLFPSAGTGFVLDILEGVRQVYGANAPEKLLFGHFTREADRYLQKVKGETVAERGISFAKLRSAEGRRSHWSEDPETGARLVEYHDPLCDLAEIFPTVHRMEETMVGKVLGTGVSRSVSTASGLTEIVFTVTSST